jgi:hypothetical protein
LLAFAFLQPMMGLIVTNSIMLVSWPVISDPHLVAGAAAGTVAEELGARGGDGVSSKELRSYGGTVPTGTLAAECTAEVGGGRRGERGGGLARAPVAVVVGRRRAGRGRQELADGEEKKQRRQHHGGGHGSAAARLRLDGWIRRLAKGKQGELLIYVRHRLIGRNVGASTEVDGHARLRQNTRENGRISGTRREWMERRRVRHGDRQTDRQTGTASRDMVGLKRAKCLSFQVSGSCMRCSVWPSRRMLHSFFSSTPL